MRRLKCKRSRVDSRGVRCTWLTAAVPVAVAALACAGCATGSGTPRSATARSGTRAVSGSTTDWTAVSYAQEVNLRLSDLPPTARLAPSLTPRQPKESTNFGKCIGTRSGSPALATRASPRFAVGAHRDVGWLQSTVSVASNSADAARTSEALRHVQLVRHCLADLLGSSLANAKASNDIGPVETTALSAPTEGIPEGFGYRVNITVDGGAPEVEAAYRPAAAVASAAEHLYLDILGFRYSNAIVLVAVESYPLPISAAEEHHVLDALYRRAVAGAATAIPSGDPAAIEVAQIAFATVERYAAHHNGRFEGITPAVLHSKDPMIQIEPGGGKPFLSSAAETEGGEGFEVTATATSAHQFRIVRHANGAVEHTCVPLGRTGPEAGGCQNGTW